MEVSLLLGLTLLMVAVMVDFPMVQSSDITMFAQGDNLSAGRSALGGIYSPIVQMMYFGGGYSSAQNESDTLDSYTIAGGVWAVGQLSQARAFPATAATSDEVAFAGGTIYTRGPVESSVVDVFGKEIYSATLSKPRTLITGAGSVSQPDGVKPTMVFAYGSDVNGNGLDVIDIYQGPSIWSSVNTTRVVYSAAATSASDGSIWIGGGFGNGVYSTVIDQLNLSTFTWSSLQLTVGRAYLTASSVDHYVIFAGRSAPPFISESTHDHDVGGQTAKESFCDTVEVFDTSTGQATVYHMSTPRSLFAAAAVGNFVLFGGTFPLA